MNSFLFQIHLSPFTPALVARIPEQRKQVENMLTDGSLVSYSLSEDRSRLWCVVNADSEKSAEEIVGNMVMFQFFNGLECVPLMFHNTIAARLPDISLN